jgi:hypothetical protein
VKEDKMILLLKYIVMVLVTILIYSLWKTDATIIFLAAALFFITIPLLIASLVIFIKSCGLRTLNQRILFGIGIFNILFFLFSFLSEKCSPEQMAGFYEDNKVELNTLAAYTHKALIPKSTLTLEFEDDTIAIFHVKAPHDTLISQHWDDANVKRDSLMKVVGLSQEELEHIKTDLKKLGCISISTDSHSEYTEIGYKRVGMGMYSFILNHRGMTPKEYKAYRESEEFIPYNKYVVFEFGQRVEGGTRTHDIQNHNLTL